MMTLLLTSPEFLAPASYRAKVKTPFEFVVSAVRATGAQFADTRMLVKAVQELGMPLYQCQPPTGYKDTADAWTNSGALVNRMNFALAFSGTTQVEGVRAGFEEVLAHDLSDTTRATIAETPRQALALGLGSPEFRIAKVPARVISQREAGQRGWSLGGPQRTGIALVASALLLRFWRGRHSPPATRIGRGSSSRSFSGVRSMA